MVILKELAKNTVTIPMDLTLIIPTHNRHDYLARILKYYNEVNFKVIIADSSKYPFLDSRLLKNKLYFHFPEMDYLEKMNSISKFIGTKYCAMCADDDFILKNSLTECVRFLELDNSYKSVQGESFGFSRGELNFLPLYQQSRERDFSENNLENRLLLYFKNYVPIYYTVVASKIYKDCFKIAILKNFSEPMLIELLYSVIALTKGFNKTLPIIFGLREISSTPNGATGFSINEFWNKEIHLSNKKRMIDILSEVIQMETNFNDFDAKILSNKLIVIYIKYRNLRKNKKKLSIIDKILIKLGLVNFHYNYQYLNTQIKLDKRFKNHYKSLLEGENLPLELIKSFW